jgi:hypothetical protein
MFDKKQCDGQYGVFRCILDQDHDSIHKSYMVTKARLMWTKDLSIVLCIQSKNPTPSLKGIIR